MAKDEAATWKAPQRDMAVVENEHLRKALATAPLVQEVLAHPEQYEKWYEKSREVLANG